MYKVYQPHQYSFFHNFFAKLYPDMYKDMLKLPVDDVPAPLPTTTLQETQRDEPSAYERAEANKIRLLDRLDGKTTINGLVVGKKIPEPKPNMVGSSAVISKFLTGLTPEESPLNKTSALFSGISSMNEKAHQVNINALMESKGKTGGVALLYDPTTNSYNSVSLNVQDLSEGVSGLVSSLTGDTSGKRRNFVGNVPEVTYYNGKVYNTLDGNDRRDLMDAIQADAPNMYNKFINRVETTVAGTEQSLDIIQEDDDNNNNNNQGGGSTSEPTGGDVGTGYVGDPGTNPIDYGVEEDKPDRPVNTKPETVGSGFVGDPGSSPKDYFDDEDYAEEGRRSGGFIGGMNPNQVTDAQTVADDYPIDSNDGDFMINAAAIEKDPQRFNEIISAGLQKAREKGIEVGDISGVGMDESGDVLASKGEFLVKKPLAETIGYDTLNQFNEQGKSEVDRRVAASGGFLDGYSNGGELGYDSVSEDFYNKIKQFSKKKAKRPEIDNFIDGLTDTEALSILFLTETEAGKDPLIHMQRIGDVVLNRVKSNSPDFKNTNTIKDVLKQRSSRGTGSKMYQFDGLEPTTLQERLLDVTERGMKNALNKTFTAAINTLDTDPDLETSRLPDNILFYKKRTPQNEGDFMDSSKFLAPLYDFGEHTFYGYFPTEEYP